MILFLILIAAMLIVAAVRDTQGDLFAALQADVPSFVIWAAALVAIGAIGFVPGLKTPSRFLLALIIVVLVVNNYQKIIRGFSHGVQGVQGAAQAHAQSNPDAAHPSPDQTLYSIVTKPQTNVGPSPAASLGSNPSLYSIVTGG